MSTSPSCSHWLRFFRGNLCQLRDVWHGQIPDADDQLPLGEQTVFEKILLILLLILKTPSAWNFSEYFAPKSLQKRAFKQSYIAISVIFLTVSLFFCSPITCLVFIFAVYRIYDISVYRLYFLFFKNRTDRWKPDELYQAIFVVFVNIYEIIVAYAIIYLYSGTVVSTSEVLTTSKEQVLPNGVTALYYSAITLLTVGYGDFVPKGEGGRIIVLLELATGLLFLAFVIPAVISAAVEKFAESKNRDKGAGPPPRA